MKKLNEWRAWAVKTLRSAFGGGETWYIGGSETLPPPLAPEEEADVLRRFDEDRSLADTLIRHNLRLVVFIARKFESCGTGIEDLISIGTIGLIKGVNTYKTDRGIRLATYASRCIENEILMHIRKNAPHRGDLSIDEPLSSDGDGGELLLSDVLESGDSPVGAELEKKEDERTVRAAVDALDEREREIIILRYGLYGHREMTQKEVADRMGISQSYISRLEKKIIASLRSKIARQV